ncbi:MAG: DUF2892 domain-containing protein [Rhodospirillales bacterium]|nr:DUF2892 domain-containing protein [Rhodospirillales bacterium]
MNDSHPFPPTTKRVAANTAEHINERVRQQTEAALAYFADHPEEIGRRLEQLDREWDIERTLEANAASFSLLGLTLAVNRGSRWLALPIGVAAFLLQHALQGWCPPVPIFRRLGVRTASEISRERYALKVLRGDFRGTPPPNGSAQDKACQALAAAEA